MVYVVPSSGLCKEIEATERRLHERLVDNDIRNFRLHTLGSAVKSKDIEAFSQLEQLRRGIPRGGTGSSSDDDDSPPNNPFGKLKN